jgi:uncharacterized protein
MTLIDSRREYFMRRVISAAALSLTLSSAAGSAGFDCAKAASAVEKAVCADSALSNLDEYLARYYSAALEALGDGVSCLKSDQRNWLKTVRNPCGSNSACLSRAYLTRLATLDGLQPGATALKNVDLPSAPVLLATIPPEADAAAPTGTETIELRGQLVHEAQDINNMGYAVKPEQGATRAFVYDMGIGNSPSHDIVRRLIEHAQEVRFMVRGIATGDGGFSDGACRFVFRVD